jgi:hypothetical protein
VFPDFAEW